MSRILLVIWRSDTTNGQPGRNTFVFLGCERGGKYRQYKKDPKMATGTRKCDCPFRLRGRPLKNGEEWKVRVL